MPITSSYEEFTKRYHFGNNDISVYKAIDIILDINDIECKCELDAFCGGKNRKKLYNLVKNISKTHWSELKEPEAAVRAHYEKKIKGYKIYKGKLSYDESYKMEYNDGYTDGYHSKEYNFRKRNVDAYDEGYWEGRQEALLNM